mgnify:CR=1 FL=1
MKEIIFRAKRKDNGKWAEGYYFKWGYRTFLMLGTTGGFDLVDVFPESVGQFTGLTDKNGEKIFEGDIVKGDLGLGYGDNENHIAYIEYQEDGMSFCLVEILEEDFGKCAEISDDLEVIGNIYDNPELLGEEK